MKLSIFLNEKQKNAVLHPFEMNLKRHSW